MVGAGHGPYGGPVVECTHTCTTHSRRRQRRGQDKQGKSSRSSCTDEARHGTGNAKATHSPSYPLRHTPYARILRLDLHSAAVPLPYWPWRHKSTPTPPKAPASQPIFLCAQIAIHPSIDLIPRPAGLSAPIVSVLPVSRYLSAVPPIHAKGRRDRDEQASWGKAS